MHSALLHVCVFDGSWASQTVICVNTRGSNGTFCMRRWFRLIVLRRLVKDLPLFRVEVTGPLATRRGVQVASARTDDSAAQSPV
jgi:hypothetical protein